MKKECFKCLETKDISEFYKHKAMADGHLNKCKACTRNDVSQHRTDNIDSVREYDRKRGSLPHRIKARDEYQKTTKGRAAGNRAKSKYIKTHPAERAAHIILDNAIRAGRIKKGPCAVCNTVIRIHGHHEDYAKPLDVTWLCQEHHPALHKERRAQQRKDC